MAQCHRSDKGPSSIPSTIWWFSNSITPVLVDLVPSSNLPRCQARQSQHHHQESSRLHISLSGAHLKNKLQNGCLGKRQMNCCFPPVQQELGRLQISPCAGRLGGIFRHEFIYLPDIVRLLCTAFAHLPPIVQDFLQLFHPELLQVHRAQVNLLVVF